MVIIVTMAAKTRLVVCSPAEEPAERKRLKTRRGQVWWDSAAKSEEFKEKIWGKWCGYIQLLWGVRVGC